MKFKSTPPPAQRNHARELINAVIFTHHALARMDWRNISIPSVLGAIDQGEYVSGFKNDCVALNGLHVIMDSNIVVTAFYRGK